MRIFTVTLLLAAAFTIALKGEVAVPGWLQGIAIRMDMTVEAMAKLLVGVSLALASAITILGTRGRMLAGIAAIAITFSGVADVAAWFRLEERGTILWPLLQLIAGMTSVVLWQSSKKTEAPPQRHPALRFTLIAVGVIFSSVISAQINITPAPTPAPRIDQTPIARDEDGRLRVNNFYPEEWQNKTLEETEISRHLPQLVDQIGSETTVVMFYSPYCEVCHEIFDNLIAPDPPDRVIAIEVPAAGDPSTRDMPEKNEVHCPDCLMLSLPGGPMWLITTPVVMTMQDGVITCVSTATDADPERCLDLARGG